MAKVLLSLQGTVPTSFPAGTTFGGYIFSIPGLPSQVKDVAPFDAEFLDVPAGDHIVSVNAIDLNQGVLGDIFTELVTVKAPDVIINVPAAVSALVVTVTP
jgi:hypothetical protein